MNKSDHFVSVNGEIVLSENATIPAIQSGLFYGAGCFETMRTEQGKIFRFKKHIERLNRGLAYLGVPEYLFIDTDELRNQITALLNANQLSDEIAKVRVQVSLDEQAGYGFDENLSLITIINCTRYSDDKTPVKLTLSDVRTVPNESRPCGLKLSNMLHYRGAYREAKAKGFDDSLMLNTLNFVAETSVANIFWLKKGTVYTPSKRTDILPGIMREEITALIQNRSSYNLKVGEFTIENIKSADFVWITNSLKEIAVVERIDEVSFPAEHEIVSFLMQQLQRQKETENYE